MWWQCHARRVGCQDQEMNQVLLGEEDLVCITNNDLTKVGEG
jgi:hypothetical protein